MNEGMHEKNHAQITRLIQQRSVASLHHHRILHVLISVLAAAQSNAFCSEQLPACSNLWGTARCVPLGLGV